MSELPKGWVRVPLDQAAQLVRGITYKKNDASNAPGEDLLPILRANNIQNGNIVLDDFVYIPSALIKPDQYIKNHDILIAMSSGSRNLVGKAGIAKHDFKGGFGAFCGLLRPLNCLDARYVAWFTRSKYYSDLVSSLSKGVNINNLKPSHFSDISLPLAPLKEQIRIADKLDSILAKIDKAQVHLEKIPTILKRFHQSVLAAATSGELTREWRRGNDHQWKNVQLRSVGKGFNYGSSAKSKPDGAVPVLRMGNLQGGKLDWKDLVYTSDEAEIEKYLLDKGDVLFNRTNSPELVGKTSIYRGEQKAIYAGYLIRIKGSELLDTEFLNIQLNSPHARDYCWQVKTDGVSQSNINAQKLQAYEFDLPTIDEQREIVSRVNELFSHADLFERQYLASKKRFNYLTQSIIAKAFRGELVEQDSNDEPASHLLERIKKQKLDAPKPAKRIRTTKNVNSTVESEPTVAESNLSQSEILTLLQKSNGELTAQQIMNKLTEQTFEQVDVLFTELKRLLDIQAIAKVGTGERCTFKAIKK